MRFKLFVFLLFATSFAVAQVTFIKTFGGPQTDLGLSVQQTTDTGYILFGYSLFDTTTSDLYLIKTDEEGNELWSMRYGDHDWDIGISAKQISDGGYILCGASSAFGEDSLMLIKTDAFGNMIWNNKYSGTIERDVGQSVQQTTDGGFIAVGFTGLSFDEDIYMVKTDIDGNELWNKIIPSSGREYAVGVQLTDDGGFALVGETNARGHGGQDMLLLKTDGYGDTIWSKTFGTTADELGRSLYVTSDNGFIVLGYEYFPGGNLYLVKTDSLGNEEWSKYYGGPGWDMGNSVQQTSDGGYILAGRRENLADSTNDFYCIKTDNQGNVTWEYTYPKSFLSEAFSIHQTFDGGYIALGNTVDTVVTLNGDFYLVKINSQGLISVYENEKNRLFVSAYPNPAIEYFIIDLSDDNNRSFNLSIFNLQGQKLKSMPRISSGKTRIETDDLARGLYFLEVSIANRIVASGKLILQ